jgi:nitrogen fixation/metabolism regulation signal transduction histidine kinase
MAAPFFKRFNVQLTIRLVVLFIGLGLLALGSAGDVRSSLLLMLAIIIVIQGFSLVRYINHTNRELESFLAGLRFGDFQQTYTIRHLGPSFHALEKQLQITVEKFKSLRSEKEQQANYYQALVQHIPLPFFVVHADDRVEVLNNATRRAFNVADITNTSEFANYGAVFQRDVLQIKPGEALLCTIEQAGTQEYFIMTATQLTLEGKLQKLVSLQNVQSELDATELATWQNLLRVTSHEILNSLAPVSSCAQTARALVDDALEHDIQDRALLEEMHDIRESVETVLRRSEGLARFIQSYRQLTRMPPPKKRRIDVGDYFHRLESLVGGDLARKRVALDFSHAPRSLQVVADEDMLDQALINLIRNAADALAGSGDGESENAQIDVRAYIDGKQRTVLEVHDNGPGIAPDMAQKIFQPFFTTRQQGSGVGLALVRYIMLSHGGNALYAPGASGGSVFRLVF